MTHQEADGLKYSETFNSQNSSLKTQEDPGYLEHKTELLLGICESLHNQKEQEQPGLKKEQPD